MHRHSAGFSREELINAEMNGFLFLCVCVCFPGASISLRLTQHVMEAQHQAESKELSDQMQQMHSDAQQKVKLGENFST